MSAKYHLPSVTRVRRNMSHFKLFVVFVLVLFVHHTRAMYMSEGDSSASPNSLIARFQSSGIRGYVLFTENGTSTSITTKIFNNADNREVYSWKVLNTGFGLEDAHASGAGRCSGSALRNPIYLAFDLAALLGPLVPVKQNLFDIHLNFVTGEHAFLGKTLMLRGEKSGVTACALILPFENKNTSLAHFRFDVLGQVYFMQSGNMFSIVSALHHSQPLRRTALYEWSILALGDQITESTQRESFKFFHNLEAKRCSALVGKQVMRSNDHNHISVSSERSTLNSRSYINLVDVSLPERRFLVFTLSHGGQIRACARIEPIRPKKIVANLTTEDLKVTVALAQESPLDPTLVDIEVHENTYAYSYGIDELPTIHRGAVGSRCENIHNIIFNPAVVSPFTVPIEGLGTSDQYAIGDLSGKYGTLQRKSGERISTVDFNLPLFGAESIVGRALVFYSTNGTILGCMNLDPEENEMSVAFATFDTPIQGQLILKQPKGLCNEDTLVYLEVSREPEAMTNITFRHSWTIRERSVASENSWSTQECDAAGGVFNPFNRTDDPFQDCSAFHLESCRLGEMMRKFRTIDIAPFRLDEAGMPILKKYYVIDAYLPLCGPNSVVDRSILIGLDNMSHAPLACTNIVALDNDNLTENSP